MGVRRDISRMSDRELLESLYEKVELLDDIVRGDPDRDMKGLQKHVAEIHKELQPLKEGRIVRQAIITSVASIITTIAAIATVVSLVWQLSG